MEQNQNDSLFNEAFKIISTNKTKANSLKQSLSKDNENNKDNNLNIIQYLSEFEYDLKTLYDILRDLKLLYHEMNNNKINKNIKENNNKDYKKNKKDRLHLKNEFNLDDNKDDGISKTYIMTTQYDNNNQNRSNISEHYINSYPRKNLYDRKIPRSISCKSYVGNWNTNTNGFEFLDNNLNKSNYNNNKKYLEYKKYNENKFPDNILNHKFLESKYFSNSTNNNINLPKDKTLKLNFDYDAYLTDYTLNRTYKNDLNSTNNNENLNNSPNLNLSDLKNENNENSISNNNIISQNMYNPSNSINKNNNINKDSIVPNKNDNNKNENNNVFTFAQPKNNEQNLNDYIVTFDPKKMSNIINNNNENPNNEDINKYNNNSLNQNNFENNINNKYNFNDLNKNKYQSNIIDNNNILDQNKINNYYHKYLNEQIQKNQNKNNDIINKDNNNKNYNYDINNNENVNYLNNKHNLNNNNDYNNIENNENDDELELEKKEIIKNIISEIFQDPKKLDLIKKELGDDIGHKLLSGNITEEQLYKIAEILKNYQINNYGPKRNYRHFSAKKFNQASDKILLKESLDNKRYHYREYPRGWASTKDYFVNNGTTYNKRGKKY